MKIIAILLQQLTWYNIVQWVLPSVLSTGVVTYLIIWRRFRRLDSERVLEKRAHVRQINVGTEIQLSTESMKLATYLREQLDALRNHHDKVQTELNKERDLRMAQRSSHENEMKEWEIRMEALQDELDGEKK